MFQGTSARRSEYVKSQSQRNQKEGLKAWSYGEKLAKPVGSFETRKLSYASIGTLKCKSTRQHQEMNVQRDRNLKPGRFGAWNAQKHG